MTKLKKYDKLTLRLPRGTKNQLKIKAIQENIPVWKFILNKAQIDFSKEVLKSS